jgi:homoserine kinase
MEHTAIPFSTRALGSSGAAMRAAVTLAGSATSVVPDAKSAMWVAAFLRGNLGAESSLTDEVSPIACGNHRRIEQRDAADRQLQRAEARTRKHP